MKRQLWKTAALAALAAAFSAQAALAAEPGAGEIVDRMDAAMAYDECSMRIRFKDVKASGASRELEADVLYAKGAGTMVAFASPAREKGKRILMIGDSMWMGAPSVSKPVRLSGKDSFMGTSFTNDDIMNFDKADDYESALVGSDAESWTLEMSARTRSLPYQRVRIRIGRDWLPIEQSMYRLSGELAKTIEYSEARSYGGKRRPGVVVVRDAMTKGAYTEVRFEAIEEKRVDRARLSPDRFMK